MKKVLLSSVMVLSLSACQTLDMGEKDDTVETTVKENSIDNALKQAARKASLQGSDAQSLALYERIYKRNPTDRQAAEQYVGALIENGYLEQAAFVLESLVSKEESNEFLKLEYAKLLLKLGNFQKAEDYTRDLVNADNNNFQALHLMGIALDAQGYHPQAEKALRRALENWEGDPVPVLNNLALNLAAQGFLDESRTIMAQAQALNPDSELLTNNLEVVREVAN